MSEKLVLALDGSTSVSGAALLRRDPKNAEVWQSLASRTERDSRGQAKVLRRSVDEMLTDLGAVPGDLGGIVVGLGPGTFTGVRIAVATARGLALAMGIPVFGVSTLASLAAAAALGPGGSELERGERLVPIVDARRAQVFHATFEGKREQSGGRLTWARTGPIGVAGRADLATQLQDGRGGKIVVIGEERGLVDDLPADVRFVELAVAAEYLVIGQTILEEPHDGAGGLEARRWLAGLSEVASTRPEAGVADSEESPWGSPERVKPIYVRSPDADIHIKKMKDPWADGG